MPVAAAGYDGQKLVVVNVRSGQELDLVLRTIGSDNQIESHGIGIGPVHLRVTPEELDELLAGDLELAVVNDDIGPDVWAQVQQPNIAGADFNDSYHTLAEINDRLDVLLAEYPDLASSFIVGQSVEGRDIRGIRISGSNDDKPAFFFHGGIHAREWVSPATMMYIVDRLLSDYGVDEVVTRSIDDVEYLIVPVLNVDGYDFTWQDFPDNRFWRKNRSYNGQNGEGEDIFGVDLNRNFPVGWGGDGSSGNPGSDVYRGPFAASEPETQAAIAFVADHPNVVAYIDFHSFSELVMWPWAYQEVVSADEPEFSYIGGGMSEQIEAVHGHFYEFGPVYSTIYPASGGSVDTMYGDFVDDRFVAATTIELRDTGEFGFLLPPEEIIPTGEENFWAVLFLAHTISEPLRVVRVDDQPTSVAPGETLSVTVEVIERQDTFSNGDIVLSYRHDDGPFLELIMTPQGDNTYSAVVPPTVCDGKIDFFVTASSDQGRDATYPVFAPQNLDTTVVELEIVDFEDDLETDTGWIVGDVDDDADDGIWERVDPVGTSAQPSNDHTPDGTMCYITGQHFFGGAGSNDVDGGKTTLFTPLFSASSTEADISYARWYSNNQGNNPNDDEMQISITTDGGQNWIDVEIVTENAGQWVVYSFTLADLGIVETENLQLRFIASDYNGGSLVEAGVDDLRVSREVCPTTGDGTLDGVVDLDDLALLQECLNGPAGESVPAGCGPYNADLDTDVDARDVAAFQAAFAP